MKQLFISITLGLVGAIIVTFLMAYFPSFSDSKGGICYQFSCVTVSGLYDNTSYGIPFGFKNLARNGAAAGETFESFNSTNLTLDFIIFWLLLSVVIGLLLKFLTKIQKRKIGSQPVQVKF